AGGTGANKLEHLNRRTKSLDRHRAKRGDLDEALGKAQRLLGKPDAASWRELFHAGRQVRGLPHGRVVHAQIAADRAHYDIARIDPDADLHLHALHSAKLT